MIPTTEKIQTPLRKNKRDQRSIYIGIILILLLVTAWRSLPAPSSNAPISVNLLVSPSLPSPATATATSTSNPTQPATATAAATSTSTPTATKTPVAYSTLATTVMLSGDYVNLRSGPGTDFEVARQLTFGEPLMLLGQMNDNSWLYVQTSDGQDGWTKMTTVNLAGINLDDLPTETPTPSPKITAKVSADYVNLRTGPSIYFTKVQRLIYGDQLILTGRLSDNSWLFVKTSDGQDGWIQTTWVDLTGVNLVNDYVPIEISPPTQTATPVVLVGIEGPWIDIDLSEQTLRAYEGSKLVASFLVSTGLDLYPTERGQYRIYAKFLFSDMRGDDYFLPDVPFTMYYSGDFSIHGTYWHHNFGTQMSHGCVNMDTNDAEWLYNWAPIGTLVNIHR